MPFVLVGNHNHLLVETPQANLATGMGWFRGVSTRRLNTRHSLWGHFFGALQSDFGGAGECLLGGYRIGLLFLKKADSTTERCASPRESKDRLLSQACRSPATLNRTSSIMTDT